jgi:hypothetical protein
MEIICELDNLIAFIKALKACNACTDTKAFEEICMFIDR